MTDDPDNHHEPTLGAKPESRREFLKKAALLVAGTGALAGGYGGARRARRENTKAVQIPDGRPVDHAPLGDLLKFHQLTLTHDAIMNLPVATVIKMREEYRQFRRTKYDSSSEDRMRTVKNVGGGAVLGTTLGLAARSVAKSITQIPENGDNSLLESGVAAAKTGCCIPAALAGMGIGAWLGEEYSEVVVDGKKINEMTLGDVMQMVKEPRPDVLKVPVSYFETLLQELVEAKGVRPHGGAGLAKGVAIGGGTTCLAVAGVDLSAGIIRNHQAANRPGPENAQHVRSFWTEPRRAHVRGEDEPTNGR